MIQEPGESEKEIPRKSNAAPEDTAFGSKSGDRVGPGASVRFYDARGRFVAGTVIDDESFRVVESNVFDPWTVFYKHPFWTWEECLETRKGATRLRPRALIGFKKLIDVDWRRAS